MTGWRIDIESESLGVSESEWRDRLEVFIEHLEADPHALGAIAAGTIGHLGAVFVVEAPRVMKAAEIATRSFLDAVRAAAGGPGFEIMRMDIEPEDFEPLEVVGATEVAQILGVARQRVYQLQIQYDDFPVPVAQPKRGALWDRREIVAWSEKERPAGRPLVVKGQEVKITITRAKAPAEPVSLEAHKAKVSSEDRYLPSARRGRKRAAARKPAARRSR